MGMELDLNKATGSLDLDMDPENAYIIVVPLAGQRAGVEVAEEGVAVQVILTRDECHRLGTMLLDAVA